MKILQLLLIVFLFSQCTTDNSSSSKTQIPEPELQYGQSTPQPEAYSLDKKPLFPMVESPKTIHKKDSLLQIAKTNFETTPDNLDNIIWYGRRTAYLSHYQKAIEIFTNGMHQFPNSPELYRHRGHRYISIRKFDLAIADFEKAAALAEGRTIEIEPDGLPNKLNIPLSSLQFNIWYHLGLAHYLKGDFANAKVAYEKCMEVSINPDLLTATSDWLYMTYQKLGDKKNANKILENINPDLKIVENASYFNRLLMYKGLKQPEDLLDFDNKSENAKLDIVTQGYGVGNWYLQKGDTEKAKVIFKEILKTDYWSAFGYIAAEAAIFNEK